jgi:hypothetical protein
VFAAGVFGIFAPSDIAGNSDESAKIPEQQREMTLPPGTPFGLEDELLDSLGGKLG